MISLSRRIMVATVALTAISVGVAAGALWIAVRYQTVASVDQTILKRMARFTTNLQNGRLRTPSRTPINETMWCVIDVDTGSEFMHSTMVDRNPLTLDAQQHDAATHKTPFWITLDDGRRLRAFSARVDRSDPPPPDVPIDVDSVVAPKHSLVLLATDATTIDQDMQHFAIELGVLWCIACGFSSLASIWLRRAVLLPVHRLAGAIRAIDIEHLPTAIPAEVPMEMVVVRERLDDLMMRLRQVLDREKGTIANIAHELRTPIAGLRTTLEFSALGDDAGGKVIANLCLPTVLAMQAMIANLLILARIEAGHETVEYVPVDLGRLVRDSWLSMAPLAARRRITLQEPPAWTAALASSCPDKSRMVISNLLDNAISHSPSGSVIQVNLNPDAQQIQLSITNPISGPPPNPSDLFQAFWRNDRARGSGGLHCGLGLALCRRLITLLGGQIDADTSRTGFFSIVVRFPTTPPTTPPTSGTSRQYHQDRPSTVVHQSVIK